MNKNIGRHLLVLPFLILSFFGLISFYEYNILPINIILEVLLILCFGYVIRLKGGGSSNLLTPYYAIAYLFVTFLMAVIFDGGHLFDFIQAYKAFFYIAILHFIHGSKLLKVNDVELITLVVLFSMLIKYGYSVILRLDERLMVRPGLFLENNFELLFIFSLVLFLLEVRSRYSLLLLCISFAVAFLSSSRSGLLLYAIVFSYYFIFIGRGYLKKHIFLILISVFIYLTYLLFVGRLEGGVIYDVDRFRFLQIFLVEINEWTLINYLFGTKPLTPLSDVSCYYLRFYEGLFSFKEDGSCYSVILHSYILRVIYDHGLVAFGFLLFFYYYCIYKIIPNKYFCISFIGLFLISSLSVSSFNSIVAIWAVAVIFSVGSVEHA